MQQDEMIISNNERKVKWINITLGCLIIIFFIYILFYQNKAQYTHAVTELKPTVTQTVTHKLIPLSVIQKITFSEIPKIRFSQIPTVLFSEIPAIEAPLAAQPEFFSEPSMDETQQAITAAHADYKKNDFHAIIDTVIVLPQPVVTGAKVHLPVTGVSHAKPNHHSQAMPAAQLKPIQKIQSATAVHTHLIPTTHTTGYTIQLVAFTTETSIKSFEEKHHLQGINNIHSLQAQINGKLWNVLTFGHYKTYTEAQNAIKQLPADLQQAKPWAKSLGSYQ